MVIYVDSLFIINSLMVFCAYGISALVLGYSFRVKRLAVGACLVSAIGLPLFILPLPGWLKALLLLPYGITGTYLCFGPSPLKINLRLTPGAFISAFVIGGLRAALNSLLPGAGYLWVPGAIAIGAAALALGARGGLAALRGRHIVGVTVYRGMVKVSLTALADTGNELRGANLESVIVADTAAAAPLFINPGSSLRLLPYRVPGSSGVFRGILCDYALIGNKKIKNVIVAAAPLSLGGGCNALVNPIIEQTGR